MSNRKQIIILSTVVASILLVGLWLLGTFIASARTTGSEWSWQSGEQRDAGEQGIVVTATYTRHIPIVSASDNVFYVSPQGNDNNDGQSRPTAFRTIGQALNVIQPGNTVLIQPGTYSETLMVENVGSLSAPITLRGNGSGVILDGQSTMTLGLWCEGCMNFVFENLEIRNYADVGIGVYLSSDIVMRKLTVHNNGFAVQLVGWELEGYGIHVDESQRITVEDSEVYENGPQPRPWGVLGTGINTYMCTGCVVRNNHSHDNIGGGILVEDGVNVLVDGNQVIANDLDATEDEWWDGGIWIDGGHDITVTNNLFQSNLGPGIQVSDEDNQQPYGYVLENNVSTGNYYGIYIWNFGTSGFPPDNILRLTNNQFSGNTIQDVWIIP